MSNTSRILLTVPPDMDKWLRAKAKKHHSRRDIITRGSRQEVIMSILYRAMLREPGLT